jgi:hypothetical protein
MFIEGIWYQFINVLFLLMQSAGPTPVIGLNGTTAGFIHSAPAIERGVSVTRLR